MYNFKVGESYVYIQEITVEVPVAGEMKSTGDLTIDVLEVMDNEIVTRTTITTQMPGVPQIKMVMRKRMTRKGRIISFEIENVEPPELMENVEKEMGGWQRLLENARRYPEVPMPIGREWEVPVDFDLEIQPGMTLKLQGKASSSIDGKETLTVRAGTFECWRLVIKIYLSGQTSVDDQTMEMTMTAEGNVWVDQGTGAEVKVNMPMEMGMKIMEMEMETSMTMMLELVEYRAAP
jgi:hypothetical protein